MLQLQQTFCLTFFSNFFFFLDLFNQIFQEIFPIILRHCRDALNGSAYPAARFYPDLASAPPTGPFAAPAGPAAAQQAQRLANSAVEMLELGKEEEALAEIQRALQVDPANRLAQSLLKLSTDEVKVQLVYAAVGGISDIIHMPGLVNVDFEDVKTVMSEPGKAMMGTGEASGEDRAIQAAEKAIANPLLDEISLKGARGVLINITGGSDLTLFELDEAANRIREEVDPDANIIVGSTMDDSLQGAMRVSVVATGIDAAEVKMDLPVARRSMAQPLTQTVAAEAPKAATPSQLSVTSVSAAPAQSPVAAKEPSLFDVPAFAAAHWQHNFGLCKAAQEREDNEHRND